MVSRSRTLLLLVVLAAVLVGAGVATGDPKPQLTVENERSTTQYVTAYTVPDTGAAGYVNFAVTTDEGEWRLVTYHDLAWPGEYRNVTLRDEDVPRQEIVVEPNETVTTSVEHWEKGDVTLYIVEEGTNRTHTGTRTVTCGQRGQKHRLTFPSGSGFSGGYTCAGGFGWLFSDIV